MQTENDKRTEQEPRRQEVTFDETWRTPDDDPDATWPLERRTTRGQPRDEDRP